MLFGAIAVCLMVFSLFSYANAKSKCDERHGTLVAGIAPTGHWYVCVNERKP